MLRSVFFFVLLLFVGSCRLSTDILVPQEAFDTLEYISVHGKPKPGYVGGGHFGNYEQLLPKKTDSGARIKYKKWDIYPKIKGQNRGPHRLVTGSDGKAYYTFDHYSTFIEINLKQRDQ